MRDQLGRKKGDINGVREISGLSGTRSGPCGPCGPCGLRLVGLEIPRGIEIIGEFNINTALACSFSLIFPTYTLFILFILFIPFEFIQLVKWSRPVISLSVILGCLPTWDMDIY